jgi:hypothetical protein
MKYFFIPLDEYYASPKKLLSSKHSSLFHPATIDNEKMFSNIGSRSTCEEDQVKGNTSNLLLGAL